MPTVTDSLLADGAVASMTHDRSTENTRILQGAYFGCSDTTNLPLLPSRFRFFSRNSSRLREVHSGLRDNEENSGPAGELRCRRAGSSVSSLSSRVLLLP